jgi:hypothetical protein
MPLFIKTTNMKLTIVRELLFHHLTEEHTQSLFDHDVGEWHTKILPVELSWGLEGLPIKANVVALRLLNKSFPYLTVAQNVDGRPTIYRQLSPPLGIPLKERKGMEEKYQQ